MIKSSFQKAYEFIIKKLSRHKNQLYFTVFSIYSLKVLFNHLEIKMNFGIKNTVQQDDQLLIWN